MLFNESETYVQLAFVKIISMPAVFISVLNLYGNAQ